MKYFMIFLVIVGLSANDNLEMYKQQVKSLMNYKLKLQSHLYNIFTVYNPIKKQKNKKTKILHIKVQNNIILLAILNNKVLLKINNQNRWVKIGEKTGDYKIVKILNNNSVIILDNKKMRILSLKNNKNKFKIKVR